MDDRLARIESEVAALARLVRQIGERVAAIEARGSTVASDERVARGEVSAPAPPAAALESGPVRVDVTAFLALAGRTFLVLAGAFLLRALTDGGLLPPPTGVTLGLIYAMSWIALADRAARRARSLDAFFHGLAANLIALPLLFEANQSFALLGTREAALALTLFTAIALGLSARRRLRALAWTVVVGGLGTALALMAATTELAPFCGYLLLLGLATLWMGYLFDWMFLRWPVALGLDFCLVFLTFRSVVPQSLDKPGAALVVQLLLLATYLASFATRTLFLGRDIIPFEVVQSIAAIVVGLGGAAYVMHVTGLGVTVLGVASMMFAAGAYATAFAFVERQRRLTNFFFYTTVALVFTLVGLGLILRRPALAMVWAGLALVSGWLAHRFDRLTLAAHGTVYVLAAALASGLLRHGTEGLVGPVSEAWSPVPAVAFIVLGAAAACTGIPARAARSFRYGGVPKVVTLTVFVWGLAGVLVVLMAPALAGTPGQGADAGVMATVRTAVLASLVLALGWASRFERYREAGALVHPLLILTGFKFLVEDFPRSRPATLFLALALYGTALIVAPRVRRRTM